MTNGKSITMFLMDGTTEGRIKCSLTNWTGVVYKIPRSSIAQFRNRSGLKQAGVYFLFGEKSDDGRPVIYVGQAAYRKNGEGILGRLNEHDRSKKEDYWTEAVAIVTTNNRLGATQISYLENYFYKQAKQAGRYNVKNATEPAAGSCTEEEESELHTFIEYSKLIIETLGYKPFVTPKQKPAGIATPKHSELMTRQSGGRAATSLLYLRRKSKRNGQLNGIGCLLDDGTFVVYKGSTIAPKQYVGSGIKRNMRERRAAAEVKDGVLMRDEIFTSPSSAATFVVGQSTNGLTEWKDERGRTLDKIVRHG